MRLLFASFCTPFAKSGRCDKRQGGSLGSSQGKPFCQVLGLWCLCSGVRMHPLPSTRHFPAGSSCVGCPGAPSRAAQPRLLLGAASELSVCPGSAQGIGSMPTQKMPSGLFLLPAKSITCAETANLVAPETKNNWESFYQLHCDV